MANKKLMEVNGVQLYGKARELYLDEEKRKEIIELAKEKIGEDGKTVKGLTHKQIAEKYDTNAARIYSVLKASGITAGKEEPIVVNGVRLEGKARELYLDEKKRKEIIELSKDKIGEDGKTVKGLTYKQIAEKYDTGATQINRVLKASGITAGREEPIEVNGVQLKGKARELYLDEEKRNEIIELVQDKIGEDGKTVKGLTREQIAEKYNANATMIYSVLKASGITAGMKEAIEVNGVRLEGKARELYLDEKKRKEIIELSKDKIGEDGKTVKGLTHKQIAEKYDTSATQINSVLKASGMSRWILDEDIKETILKQIIEGDLNYVQIAKANEVSPKLVSTIGIKNGIRRAKESERTGASAARMKSESDGEGPPLENIYTDKFWELHGEDEFGDLAITNGADAPLAVHAQKAKTKVQKRIEAVQETQTNSPNAEQTPANGAARLMKKMIEEVATDPSKAELHAILQKHMEWFAAVPARTELLKNVAEGKQWKPEDIVRHFGGKG